MKASGKLKRPALNMPKISDYIGVFCVAFATLMYELLLTRLFSVVMWYHFAFVAISAALFGMALGAVGVYCYRHAIAKRGERIVLAEWSLYFGLSIIPALLIFIFLPVGPLLIISILPPFIASGVTLALALTYFSGAIGYVYAADLIGAATGCFGVFAALKLTDGPTAVLASALVALIGGLCFGMNNQRIRQYLLASILFLILLISGSFISITFHRKHIFRIINGKHGIESNIIYEEWNSFSRVDIRPAPSKSPFGDGFSDKCPYFRNVDQLLIRIDGDALTQLTKYDGVPAHYKYLGCDITNIAGQLIPNAHTAVIGAGGGRDVLSALVFGAKSVKAIELNDEILAAVNKKYANFSGHLNQINGVSFVNDEARSYLTRNSDRYDLIQISLIDTWAATAAGGYTISENSLYTTEAWKLFMQRLTDRGILSVTRWYKDTGVPFESYRTVSLAQEALKGIGIQDPEKHIALVFNATGNEASVGLGLTTLLVSREPLSPQTLATINNISQKYNFTILASPDKKPSDPVIAALVKGNLTKASSLVKGNITPPSDNRPFFFNFIRLNDLFTPSHWKYHNLSSLGLLLIMAAVIVGLVVSVFTVPFRFAPHLITKKSARLATYFLGIGFGFLSVEIGFLQRFSIFFGNPAFSLLVVLPTILAASGLGSMASSHKWFRAVSLKRRILLLTAVLAIAVIILPTFISHGAGWGTPERVLAAITFLLPVGFFMGMPFAMGMRWASKEADDLKPWLWGLNGAASVAASVLAVLVSILGSITLALCLGIVGYLVTALAAGKANLHD